MIETVKRDAAFVGKAAAAALLVGVLVSAVLAPIVATLHVISAVSCSR